MSKRELWEIVRADELKVGDVVAVAYWHLNGLDKGDIDTLCGYEKSTIFRRSGGHHPDVLMRVIQNMHSEIRGWNEVGDYPTPTDSIDKYIAEAEAEIAKERES